MDSFSDSRDQSGYSAHDVVSLGYLQLDWFLEMMESTEPLDELEPHDYDAVFLVGGQGPMYTFRGNVPLQNVFAAFYESGKPSAAVCHATTLLLEAVKSDGELIVNNKTWTGFANSEEDYVDQAVGQIIQPYRIEDESPRLSNTTFEVAPAFSAFAIADDNLITGQQQNSGSAVAQMVIDQLRSDDPLDSEPLAPDDVSNLEFDCFYPSV